MKKKTIKRNVDRTAQSQSLHATGKAVVRDLTVPHNGGATAAPVDTGVGEPPDG